MDLLLLIHFFRRMISVSFILHFYIILSIKKIHITVLKEIPSNQNSLYFHNRTYHKKLTISLIVYYHVQFYNYLLLFSNNILVRNQVVLTYLYVFRLIHCLFVNFYFLVQIKLPIFYQNYYLYIYFLYLYESKILCAQHISID